MDTVRLSKLLSLILRHDPGRFGVELDAGGWIDVTDLVAAVGRAGVKATPADIELVVRTSDKQRFALDTVNGRIRANQGHSVPVDLGLTRVAPPAVLYHGTALRNLDAIMREGLTKQSRHAVHLSADVATAHRVGARRGPHAVLVVAAIDMHAAGHQFTRSANGVWLVDRVPPEYLTPEG